MAQPARTPFPCNGCGKCCRQVDKSAETDWLDRGDGVCRHFDETSKRCLIYAERPLVCRVEEYYARHLSTQVSWEHFVAINLDICARLPGPDAPAQD
ncbi:YkgJ family cysteine cluster protein [Pseudoduganella sp. FT25W]|jgi:Fe-S-cluster containining protein|uniref:YkgJ family cysteine cluster protein n=1 Tax=Duganella alba TaxID=2666081 RepID=A0A6L5QC56_9BURK|nr:YkgJ family cysteine cluster protein [Duganella alba]MRX07229.1 YkgJ family cysteine cluster protein [Duganella alba]MRX15076.1 YkgJ family cysteine cluster protein [Duganella alba]